MSWVKFKILEMFWIWFTLGMEKGVCFNNGCLDFEFAGGEVEGFVFEAKGRDQIVEECDTVPWCYEFSASRASREARFGAEAGKTGYSCSAAAGFFSHWPASKPCGGPCWGIILYITCIHVWQQFIVKSGKCWSLKLVTDWDEHILTTYDYVFHWSFQ